VCSGARLHLVAPRLLTAGLTSGTTAGAVGVKDQDCVATTKREVQPKESLLLRVIENHQYCNKLALLRD